VIKVYQRREKRVQMGDRISAFFNNLLGRGTPDEQHVRISTKRPGLT